MSGHIYRPYSQILSPTFDITTIFFSRVASPLTSFIEPVPPARTVIVKCHEEKMTHFIFSANNRILLYRSPSRSSALNPLSLTFEWNLSGKEDRKSTRLNSSH